MSCQLFRSPSCIFALFLSHYSLGGRIQRSRLTPRTDAEPVDIGAVALNDSADSQLAPLESNSNNFSDKDKCDLCPKGQKDSTQCKDMFFAWMSGVSIYNAVVPLVPIDVAVCCPCYTKRWFMQKAPDVTALAERDIQKLFELPNGEEAGQLTHRFRLTSLLRNYRKSCQVSFDAKDKVAQALKLPAALRKSHTVADKSCSAMEEDHPELAYFWANELINDVCPSLVPYVVELRISDEAVNNGLDVPATKLQQLYKLASNSNLRSLIAGKSEAEAGQLFVRWLLDRDNRHIGEPVDFGGDGQPPVFADGTLKLDEWFPGAWRAEADTDLMKLLDTALSEMKEADIISTNPIMHIQTLRKLEQYLHERFPTGTSGREDQLERDSSSILLQALDPIGLLDFPGGAAELQNLKIVGYREPKITQERSSLYSGVSSAFFGAAFSWAASSAGITVGAWTGLIAGAGVGGVTVPVLGAVPFATMGAIVGGSVGLVGGLTSAITASGSHGTLVLQGWRVATGSKPFQTKMSSVDEVFVNTLNTACAFYKMQGSHQQVPAHSEFGTKWRKSGKLMEHTRVPHDSSFWREIAISVAIVRERYMEQESWDVGIVDYTRRKIRRQWLRSQLDMSQDSTNANSLRGILEQMPPLVVPAATDMNMIADDEDVEDLPPLLGDMPASCWTQGITSFFKMVWDRFVGTNGRGLICKQLSRFLNIGISGVKVLVLDPYRGTKKWLSAVRPSTFWYEAGDRDAEAVTGPRLLKLLQRAAGLTLQNHSATLENHRANGVFVAPKALDAVKHPPKRLPIYAYVISEASNKFAKRGPRIGVVSPGEPVKYSNVLVTSSGDVFIQVEVGWLAPCRYVYKRLGVSMKEARLSHSKCLHHLKRSSGGQGIAVTYMTALKSMKSRASFGRGSRL